MICEIVEKTRKHGASFAQQYVLHKGLKKFGNKGTKAISEEMNQLHQRNCFTPILVTSLTKDEKRKAMEALMFFTEKRDGRVKALQVYNRKPIRAWIDQQES